MFLLYGDMLQDRPHDKDEDEKGQNEKGGEGDVADLPELEEVAVEAPEMALVEAVVPVAAGGQRITGDHPCDHPHDQ